jgi:hypothetical protein
MGVVLPESPESQTASSGGTSGEPGEALTRVSRPRPRGITRGVLIITIVELLTVSFVLGVVITAVVLAGLGAVDAMARFWEHGADAADHRRDEVVRSVGPTAQRPVASGQRRAA